MYTYTAKAINPHVWDGSIAGGFAGGSGTAEEPYQISNGAQLAYLAYIVNSGTVTKYKYYVLTCDVDLGGVNWDPIGCGITATGYSSDIRCFYGSFDGQGYTVSNLRIDSSKQPFYQLFGLFGGVSSADIKNLTIRNCSIYFDNNIDNIICGGIASSLDSSRIDNCSVIGDIHISGANITCGGIAGALDYSNINNCSVIGDIYISSNNATRNLPVGGLVGVAYGTVRIMDSYFEGSISGHSNGKDIAAGGIVGDITNFTIARCSFEGTINVTGTDRSYVWVGGIVGDTGIGGISSISDCYATGSVSGVAVDGQVSSGGIAGTIQETIITHCYTTCTVLAQGENRTAIAGGIVGQITKFGSGSATATKIHHNLSLASASANVTGDAEAWTGAIYAFKTVGTEYDNFEVKTDTVEFYTSTLGWSADVWDLSGVESGGLPTLKR